VERTKVVCPFCSVGCSFYIVSDRGRYVSVEYFTESPVNEGAICPKPNDLSFLVSPHRLTKPMRRTESGWREISWSEALREVADRIRDFVSKYGPDSIGFFVSVKMFNEEGYVAQKLARLLGTNNIDHICRRTCQFPTIIAGKECAGVGSITGTFRDIAESDVVVLWGINPAETFPILMGKYIMRARERGAKIIVVDPVKTRTAWKADLWLPVLPGTDVALANAIMHVLIKERLYREDFVRERCEGFEALARVVEKYSPEYASKICGVSPHLIREAAYTMARAERGSIIWSTGLIHNHQATDCCRALYALAALLGWYGKEGTCVGGLKGQNNVEGLVHMGVAPTALPGGYSLGDEVNRKRIAREWGVEDLPSAPGTNMLRMYEAIDHGDLRMLYIMGANPVLSEPNTQYVAEHLKKLEFLVVQDLFLTETAQLADIVLPAAAWAEKEGSFTSVERRVQWSFKALDPPGEARPDLWILVELAKRLGLERFFPYTSPEDVLREINRVVPSYGGVTPERLKSSKEGILVPCPSPDHPGTRVLCRDRFGTKSGKFVFKPVEYVPPPIDVSSEYPLILVTSRVVGMWHTRSMTGRSSYLVERWREPEALVGVETAKRLGIEDGHRVRIETRRGGIEVRVRVSDKVREDVVVLPWHWGANRITDQELRDKDSGVPAFKRVPCRIVVVGR